MNWQSGDRCIIDCPTSLVNGQRTTIRRVGVEGSSCRGGSFIGCEVDIPCRSYSSYTFCVFENHELIPIPDDDSRKKTTWDEIVDADDTRIFTPKVPVTV